MTTFFTSDTHFRHARIIEFENRPFTSVTQMDGELIRRWNRTVGPDDTVYHLGDLALGAFPDSVMLTSALMGHRFLIPGNHDRVSSVFNHGKDIERFTPLYEAAGWSILPEVVETRIGGRDVLLSHYPYDGDSRPDRPDRHASVRAVDAGLPIIHGHVHSKFAIAGRQYNVGVDIHDYTPVPESSIIDWLDTLA